MYSDRKQISGCLGTGKWNGGTEGHGRIKEGRGKFWSNGHAHYLNSNDAHGCMSMSKPIKLYTLNGVIYCGFIIP